MKPTRAVLAAILAIAVSCSSASGAGINVSWDDCGTYGAQLRSFECNTNAGFNVLVCSFVAPAGLDSMVSGEVLLSVQTDEPVLSDWWGLSSGSCRPTSLNYSFDFTVGPSSCHDYWQGGAVGVVAADPPAGNRIRIKAAGALSPGDPRVTPITEGTEVYVAKVIVNNARSVGQGSCAGCGGGACIVIESITAGMLYQGGILNLILTQPDSRNFVTWQCPGSLNKHDPSGPLCLLNCETPARPQTWGRIKQLYR